MAVSSPPQQCPPMAPVTREELPAHGPEFSPLDAAWSTVFWGWLASALIPAWILGPNLIASECNLLSALYVMAFFMFGSALVHLIVALAVVWPLTCLVENRPAWWSPVRSCACAVAVSCILLSAYSVAAGAGRHDFWSAIMFVIWPSLVMGIPAGLAASRHYRRHHALPSLSPIP